MSDKDTKAGSLMRRLQIIEAADEKRERQVKGWVDALLAAEAAAAAEGDAKWFLYQVSYRVKEVTGKTKGTADQRRNTLVRLIEALAPREKHLSTSTWFVRVHIEDAERLADLLMPPLAKFDFLSVAQVSPTNRTSRGDANLD